MLTGNKSDTYALFLYPGDERQMLNISHNYTNISKRHAKPQVGFNRGDTSTTEELFYSLFGSDETTDNLQKWVHESFSFFYPLQVSFCCSLKWLIKCCIIATNLNFWLLFIHLTDNKTQNTNIKHDETSKIFESITSFLK